MTQGPGACEECGYRWDQPRERVLDALDRAPAEIASLVEGVAAEQLGRRPAPAVWSPHEYTAHTRDAVAWYRARIVRVRDEERPLLEGCDWDRVTEQRRYLDEDLNGVLDGLTATCAGLAGLLRALAPADWQRKGVGSSQATVRTVDNLARRAAHEAVHHTFDIARILGAGTGSPGPRSAPSTRRAT